jgi:hypothetical protein
MQAFSPLRKLKAGRRIVTKLRYPHFLKFSTMSHACKMP